ncbi:MAG: DUF928 domain-containing protein [Leptolyngbyaceae cyanobacterium MO_188.B28]|nr:DUF928 domain-containing protein [Leptolyngbyaceae cyanobacterium MO_188.B28]
MFTFALITFANGLSPLLAEPETAASILQLKQLSDHEPLEFEPPNDGAPGDRKDAGSRPFCPQSDSPFTALVPVTNLGFTTAQYPTFWLYTLYSSGVIELVLMDENTKNTVYQTQFQVTEGPGIISFKLPDTAPSLEIDKKYRWTFDFLCNAPSDALSVTGVILRKSLTSTLQNQSDTPGKAGGLMNVTASKADVLAGGVSISL